MIVTIGTFDGFHRGHQTLLQRAYTRAIESGTTWGVITFRMMTGFKDFKSLFTQKEQMTLEKFFAIPVVHRIDFTYEISNMAPPEFLDFIGESLGVTGIVIGRDFKFGKDRAGDAWFLEYECPVRGWSIDTLPVLKTNIGMPLGSTGIRSAVTYGRLEHVAELLGYPYFCQGVVIHGDDRGSTLGFPTANFEISKEKVEVRRGVYSTLVFVGGNWYIGAANIGVNPTFPGSRSKHIEVNLLGYEGQLYGEELTIFLLSHIRDEIRFGNVEKLKNQVTLDIRRIREIAEESMKSYPDFWHRMGCAIAAVPPI
ncbi:MAG: riboflavin biosynthesis protein RibF [Synergistaceae bacterium]|jgi:riboflavin kinase/FMN adenylyltransferase|nr:riboflavin biosynthesis protein RibF [Synergistaceae bacterium]